MLKRNVFYNILLVVISIFLVLISFEIILRFGLVENKLYKEMLCDGERNNPKCKILVLGDSFIANWHTGNSLYQLLVKDLEVFDAKVLNTARPGRGPFDYLTEMKTKGIPFKPDIVLLFYYAGNDLTDVQYDISRSSADLQSRIRNFLRLALGRLYIYSFLKEKRDLLSLKLLDYDKIENTGIDTELVDLAKDKKINVWLLETSLSNQNYILDNVLMETKENMRAWEKVKEILHEINLLCKKTNSEFIIIILPRSVQIDKSHFPFFEKCNFAIHERTLSSNKPQRLLKDFCSERGILCLDILPNFKAEQNKQFYKTNDDHFNEDGCKFSEKIIFDFIVENTKLKEYR